MNTKTNIKTRLIVYIAVLSLVSPSTAVYAGQYEPEPGFYEFLANFVSQRGYQTVYKRVYNYYKNSGFTDETLRKYVAETMPDLIIDETGLAVSVRNTFNSLGAPTKNKLLSVYAALSGTDGHFETPSSLPENIDSEFVIFDNDFIANSNAKTAFKENLAVIDFETFERLVIEPIFRQYNWNEVPRGEMAYLYENINRGGHFVTLVKSRYFKQNVSNTYHYYVLLGHEDYAPNPAISMHEIYLHVYADVYNNIYTYTSSDDFNSVYFIEGDIYSEENYYVATESEDGALQEAVNNNYYSGETVNNEYVYIDNRSYDTDSDYIDELLKIIEGEKKGDIVNITINNYYGEDSPTGVLDEETRGFLEIITELLDDIYNTVKELPNKVFHVNVDNFNEIPPPDSEDSEKGIWGFIKSAVNFIGSILGNIFESLFILPDNYMDEQISIRQSRFAEKINVPDEYVQALLSIDGDYFGDIKGGVSMISGQLRNVSQSGTQSRFGITDMITGSVTFVDFRFLRENIETIRSWINGVFGFFLLIANFDHIYFLIRKAHIFNFEDD